MTRGRGRAHGVLVALLVVSGALSAACRQDMHDTPRFEPLEESDFFADRRSARPLIEGTVARGQLRTDEGFYTGSVNGQAVAELPMPLTEELVARGRERYDIYCSPCHARTGDGDGMAVQRGFRQPTSLHDPRLRAVPVGYFVDVITNGFGQMPNYRAQVAPRDRWAIAVYIQALQLSKRGSAQTAPPPASAPPDRAAGVDEASETPSSGEGENEEGASHE